MTREEKINELADIIYSKCGVSIRNCDSNAIATKLVDLNYGNIEKAIIEFANGLKDKAFLHFLD